MKIRTRNQLLKIVAILIAPLVLLTVVGSSRAVGASNSVAGSGGAQATVASMIESIRALGQVRDQATRRQIVKSIDDSLAIEAMARHALGQTWQTLTASQRTEFVDLMTRILEKLAYVRATDFFTGLLVDYRGIARTEKGEIVKTRVTRPQSGQIEIDYLMERAGARWRVTDIDLDGASLTESVTNQVQSALKQGSYANLIAQIRTRLAQASSSSGADGPSARCA
jgi:phospholipid transport system substrate-binding protein